jgi:hypothetical protein
MLCAAVDHVESGESQRLPDTQAKREITPEGFASFLDWLSPERDRAGEAYERLRFSLQAYFARRGSPYADELTDETINRVIVNIDEPIANKMGYCYGVARNVFRESLRKERTHLDIDEVTIAAPAAEPENFSHECLDQCLSRLPAESRNLLLEYYREAKTEKILMRRRISTSLQKTGTALRMQIVRLKRNLTVCVKQCMNE